MRVLALVMFILYMAAVAVAVNIASTDWQIMTIIVVGAVGGLGFLPFMLRSPWS